MQCVSYLAASSAAVDAGASAMAALISRKQDETKLLRGPILFNVDYSQNSTGKGVLLGW